MIYPANILITNYCNQKCPFCFAGKEMTSPHLEKEMKLDHFKIALAKIRRSGYFEGIKLLGGEPTLHSRLFEMLDLARKSGLFVQIFTNGVMDEDTAEKLALYGNGIGYTFNVTTPGFQHNPAIRTQVLKNMRMLAETSRITISLTMDPFFREKSFIQNTQILIPLLYSVRIGFSNPIAHQNNWYRFSDFPTMGPLLVSYLKNMRRLGFKGEFSMNCGFTRCMFSEKEFSYLKTQIKHVGWSCFGKESSMDIAVDMSSFHCFPLSDGKRIDLKKKSYAATNALLIKERMKLWANLKKDVCLACPHYGFGGDKCPGPCLAFQINERKEVNKLPNRSPST